MSASYQALIRLALMLAIGVVFSSAAGAITHAIFGSAQYKWRLGGSWTYNRMQHFAGWVC